MHWKIPVVFVEVDVQNAANLAQVGQANGAATSLLSFLDCRQ
jgi:hypothetical protein